MEPDSAAQLYLAVLSRVKYVHEFALNNVCF
jgi:hypothetical protein